MSSINQAIESVIQARSAAVDQQIQYALAAKALKATETRGEAAVQLIESAGRIGKAHGKGRSLDVSA